jgi:hypothetical protein
MNRNKNSFTGYRVDKTIFKIDISFIDACTGSTLLILSRYFTIKIP